MINDKKINIGNTILLFVSFFLLFKQLNVLFPPIYTLITILIGCVVVAFEAKGVFVKDLSIFWLIIYFIIVFLNYYSGDFYFDSFGDVVQEVAILFFTSSLFFFIVTSKRQKYANVLIMITLIVIIYYSVSSYLIESVNPGIVRHAVYMINVGELNDLNVFYRKGLATYQLPHALPILIPPLIMRLRDRTVTKSLKIFTVISLIAIFVIVFISYSATSLFLAFGVLIMTLLVKEGDLRKNSMRLIIAGLIVIPILLNVDLILTPLTNLFTYSDETLYINKLTDLQLLADTGTSTGGVAARESRYEITLWQIIQNPIIGTNRQTGGHAALFDRLACLGLVGWIPYIIFLVLQIKFAIKQIDKNNRVYYFLGMFAAFFMLCFKNMSVWEVWFMMFTVLPLMTWLPSQNVYHNNIKI